MNFLLEITKSDYTDAVIQTKGLTETLLFGAKMLLMGMATVFSVLCLIWLCLSLFKLIFTNISTTEKSNTAETAVTEALPIAETVYDDEEIIAVIAAAIAMAESQNAGAKFKVVSFRRK